MTTTGQDAGGGVEDVLPGLRALWSEAERRLYPLATSATELYVAAVNVVRAVADLLREVEDHPTLVARWEGRAEDLAAALSSVGGELPQGVAAQQVLGSAYALRDREIALELEERDRAERVRQARSDPEQVWVTLHERGDVRAGLANAYQCIEFHLPTRLALVSTVEQNPSTGGTNYVTSVIEMDEDGVQVVEMDVVGLGDREAEDSESFAANRRELRNLMAQRPV